VSITSWICAYHTSATRPLRNQSSSHIRHNSVSYRLTGTVVSVQYMQYTNSEPTFVCERLLTRLRRASDWPERQENESRWCHTYRTYGDTQPWGEPPSNMTCARDNVRYIDTRHSRTLDTCMTPRAVGDCVTFRASLRHAWCWKWRILLLQCYEF